MLLSFVICHLLAHSLLIVSFAAADAVFDVTMYVWQTKIGTALLLTAFFVHYGNALWSIYVRQSLRLAPWQWTQAGLGLSIPLLLMSHVMGTGVADNTLGVVGSYQSVLIAHWVAAPWHAIVQTLAVLTVWTHACIGIHFWLRHQARLCALAALSVRFRVAAAGVRAGRLHCRRQRGGAGKPQSGFCPACAAREPHNAANGQRSCLARRSSGSAFILR